MKARWIVALLPLGLGLVLAIPLLLGWLGNPMVHLHLDLGSLLFWAGLLLSTPIVLALLVLRRLKQRHRQELDQAREHVREERQRLLRRLDHELKNPLMSVRAGLAKLTGSAADPADREILASMDAQVQRTRQLTGDLRKLAQLETLELNLAPVDVSGLLQQAVELAQEQPAAQERHLALTLPQAPWPLSMASGDRELLLTAISNLLDNALKFTRPGDTVEVRAMEDERLIQIEVADTGPGIDPEDLPLLGRELYRGKNAAKAPGSGVGLALAQAIVKRHGGQLAIRSRLEQGTVVTVRLPLK